MKAQSIRANVPLTTNNSSKTHKMQEVKTNGQEVLIYFVLCGLKAGSEF